ncbi:M3 family metallopeptidase [Phytomonospora endophytica]|uniref:Peptidyl-dipeptidase Dcp n=1 Tax=Phytomonospora endophytica TaxID=714109 RepID=A0A841FZ10_9ACTN|nr:M3 family metallopeptidase [Phytomonospora endophytica]MBB6037190.1 peptidyl-dipeptidase Dcp [Phytomonospora endophytica]GIG71230.1 peptidyl-dipeptidase Dcp [Phytomonospora endophytica]
MTDNPLLVPSSLPYELPPFADIRDEHFGPAFEQGMAEHAAEVAAVAAEGGAPTFENTIEALERAGRTLARASTVFWTKVASDSNEAVRALETELSPKLAAHHDSILLNTTLFARIEALYAERDTVTDPERRRLLERYHTDFVRAGAALPADKAEALKAINTELAELATAFDQNLQEETNAALVVVDDVAELDGLGDGAIAAAARTASERGHDGKYALSLSLFTAQPALSSLTDRALRRRLYEASIGRGQSGNAELVVKIATLRAKRAALLGYDTHADYVIADQTAGTTKAVLDRLERMAPVAHRNALAEAADLASAMPEGSTLEPWDWPFYAERVRQERYSLDDSATRPYLELDRVLEDGVFFAANKLYGLSFTRREDLVGYLPEVRVYEVFNEDGSPLGLFLADYYARAAKRGGAWMNSLVLQSRLRGTKPVVVNNLNIPRPPDGEPTLLTFDEVRTTFHEFGHALHGLFSQVTYPRFSGTSVPRDFVEYPSQVNEMWGTWPEVLANYAKHHRTGEPMPAEFVASMEAAELFNEGFRSVEYLAAALLDLAWHRLRDGEEPGDPAAFEAAALEAAGIAMPSIQPRYKTNYFQHVFSGGYSAGYYSYIWSEILDADTVEWFKENDGLRRSNGDTFRAKLLSKGGSVDPLAAFADLRGREPDIEPLLKRRGLSA